REQKFAGGTAVLCPRKSVSSGAIQCTARSVAARITRRSLIWHRFVDQRRQVLDRDTLSAARAGCFLFKEIRSRDRKVEFFSIFARQPFNDRVRSLSSARIKNLHAVRLRLFGRRRPLAVENHDDANA